MFPSGFINIITERMTNPDLKNTEIICPNSIKTCIEKSSNIIFPRENVINHIATYSNTGGTTGAPPRTYS